MPNEVENPGRNQWKGYAARDAARLYGSTFSKWATVALKGHDYIW